MTLLDTIYPSFFFYEQLDYVSITLCFMFQSFYREVLAVLKLAKVLNRIHTITGSTLFFKETMFS